MVVDEKDRRYVLVAECSQDVEREILIDILDHRDIRSGETKEPYETTGDGRVRQGSPGDSKRAAPTHLWRLERTPLHRNAICLTESEEWDYLVAVLR
jgi:hypothetical protein